MTLSSTTHATVEQVEAAIATAAADYGDELERIRQLLLAPVRAEVKRQNAIARRNYAARRKKLELYRDALKAEGPGDD